MDKTELVAAMQQVRWAVVTLHDWREGGKGLKAIDEAIAFISSHDSVRDRVLEEAALKDLVELGRKAIGEHIAPEHCYSTGPLTGDPIEDLVVCPACRSPPPAQP